MNTDITAPSELQMLSAKILGGRAFLIKTPPAIQYFALLQRWLTTGMLGAVVYGQPRLGKTSATRWTLSAASQVLGRIPWIEVPARKQNLISERAFFQHLLSCAHNQYAKKGTVADKRDRFREALITRARYSSIRTVILFFDEAQLLDDMHYSWLMNISNEIESDGYRVFCLLVGQHQLSFRRETFLAEGREEIVGRYMTEKWAFPAICSSEGFKVCLQEFDAAVYPKSSGTPFIAHFLPKAYAAGWRLEKLCDDLWQQFEAEAGECDCGGDIAVPMHYLSAAVTNLLTDIWRLDEDSQDLDISSAALTLAVERSGFKNALYALTPQS